MSDILTSMRPRFAVVTGAAAGNGLAILEKFLSLDYNCFAIDKNPILLHNCHQLHRYQSKIFPFLADLADSSSFNSISSFVATNTDTIDVLINNAGVTRSASPLDYTIEDWELTIDINLKAPFFLIKAFLEKNLFSRPSSIINITSLAAEQGFPSNPAYLASKGGLKQLSKGLAIDLAPYGITVNCIGPGYVKTNMTKASWFNEELRKERDQRMIINRWAEPSDVANACAFLGSSEASYITGQDIYVDGGWLAKGL